MKSMMTRRFFIGGATASLGVFAGCRVFSAPNATALSGTPALTFGVLSDVHLCLARGGETLLENYGTEHLEKALAWFRDQGADAVVIAGDVAHSGLVGEHRALFEAWQKVFPNDRAPDGRKVERIFIYGNHEWSSYGRARRVFTKSEVCQENYLSVDPKKHWDAVFHEEWTPFYLREVKGYEFVGCHWHVGGCCGHDETFTQGLAEYYQSIRGKLDPKKPFFHIQHPHPKGTVHGDKVWGQDIGESVKVLSQFPNAISFSGHSHTTLVDERSIWQGAFTSVATGTLRDISLGRFSAGAPAGHENWYGPKAANGSGAPAPDLSKTMAPLSGLDGKQGQLVRVYSDRVVFTRRDFVSDLALQDDLVMPLPAAESKPFAFAARLEKAKAPRFAADAKVSVAEVTAPTRAIGKVKSVNKPCVEISFPPALSEKSTPPVIYKVSAIGADGVTKVFSIIAETVRLSPTAARATEKVKISLAKDRLPAGKVSFEVRAISAWGKESGAIDAAFAFASADALADRKTA